LGKIIMAIITIPPIVIPTGYSVPPTPVNPPDNWAIETGTWGTSVAAVDSGLPSGRFPTSGVTCLRFFPSVGHNARIDSGWIAVETYEYLAALGRSANKSFDINLDFMADVAGGAFFVTVLCCGGGRTGRENTIAAFNVIDTSSKGYTVNTWNKIGASFTVPPETRWIKIAISKSDGGWSAYIDNIQLAPSPVYMIGGRSVDQSIPNATNTKIAWDITHGSSGVSIAADGTVTIEESGIYSMRADLTLATLPQSTRVLTYLIASIDGNISAIARTEKHKGGTGSDTHAVEATATRLMSAGDTVYTQIWHDAGSAKTMLGSGGGVYSNQFAITKIA